MGTGPLTRATVNDTGSTMGGGRGFTRGGGGGRGARRRGMRPSSALGRALGAEGLRTSTISTGGVAGAGGTGVERGRGSTAGGVAVGRVAVGRVAAARETPLADGRGALASMAAMARFEADPPSSTAGAGATIGAVGAGAFTCSVGSAADSFLRPRWFWAPERALALGAFSLGVSGEPFALPALSASRANGSLPKTPLLTYELLAAVSPHMLCTASAIE